MQASSVKVELTAVPRDFLQISQRMVLVKLVTIVHRELIALSSVLLELSKLQKVS